MLKLRKMLKDYLLICAEKTGYVNVLKNICQYFTFVIILTGLKTEVIEKLIHFRCNILLSIHR